MSASNFEVKAYPAMWADLDIDVGRLKIDRVLIEKPVTDLPAPDSPTNPSRSPFSRVKLTPLVAVTSPLRRANLITRSLTSNKLVILLTLI